MNALSSPDKITEDELSARAGKAAGADSRSISMQQARYNR